MIRQSRNGFIVLLLLATALAVMSGTTAATEGLPTFFVPPPPFSEGIFPCSACHAGMEVNQVPRELTEHTEIARTFKHSPQQRWCLDCHNPDKRDMLRLANGDLVPFEESYKLCGQCHGEIFRDWKAGVHGKRTGEWNGKKLYRLCVHCHNPHNPRFKAIAPMPPPDTPMMIRNQEHAGGSTRSNPLGTTQ